MTENKRFVFDPSIYHFTDTATDKTYCEYNLDKVVDLLNRLNDEIEQLKNEVYDWEASAEDYLKLGQSLKKENEQLKQSMDNLFDYFAKWFEEERGIYAEDFCILWEDIQKGDVE